MTSFLTAHAELVKYGRVPQAIAHDRIETCRACAHYHGEDRGWGTGHCKACGCPSWPISRMHRPGAVVSPGKAWFPMGCPRGKFPAWKPQRTNSLSGDR